MFQTTNPPPSFSMPDFYTRLDQFGSVAKACRFAVSIKPQGTRSLLRGLSYFNQIRDFIYLCDAAEFPGRGFGITPVRYYGPATQFPNNVEYGPASLSIICRSQGIERQFFDDWQDIINPTSTFNFNYQNDYACVIDIIQFAEYGQSVPGANGPTVRPVPVYSWRLHKAWPTLVNPQPVTWADSDVLRLQVTFAYKYWDRPGDTERVAEKI